MIQIYIPTNTDYEKNGDSVLTPSSFLVSVELNGDWSISMSHPIDPEGRWKYIEEEAVIKAPSFNGDQLFRLKTVTKTDTQITATGQPIFMDAMNDCFLVDVRPTDKNGQQALDIMTAPNSKYTGQSNITKLSTAYYQFKNLIEAINGDDENSFLNRWGGEIMFDNFNVIINEQIGTDNGVEIRYGKNIPVDGFSQEVDTNEVITRIYPKSFNGYTMTGNGYVDSDLIDNYPTVKIATITFDDVKMAEDAQEGDEENGVIICDNQTELDAALTQKCEEQFAAGVDKPKVTINCQMVQLANTEQYKDYAVLETVSLGDTVHCVNNHLGIKTDARVISLTYDSILKKVDSVTIGDYEYNYFNSVTSSVNRVDSAIRPDGTVIADQISGFINGALAQLRLQNSIAQKQNVRAILFEDLDPDSPTFGAMSLGTQGLQISRQRNANNNDWEWTTALTAEGLIANIIVAGIISSKTGGSFWNLDTGEFVSETTSGFTGDIQIKDGHITSEGTLLGWFMKLDMSNGGIVLTWEQGGYSGSATINGTTIRLQNDGEDSYIAIARGDGGWYTRAYGENPNNNAALGPGDIEINNKDVMAAQSGKFSANIPAGGWTQQPITFPIAFSEPPTVIPIFESTSDAGEFGECNIAVNSVTTTGANIKMFNNGAGNRAPNVFWIAFGR